MPFKQDIANRIHSDFGEVACNAFEILENAIEKTDSLNSDRVIRCIIFLAKGNIDELKKYVNAAATDPRDIMLWAEYEKSEDDINYNRLRDFSNTFEGSLMDNKE